jgi:uncharacterized membrane protein YfcA
MIVYLIEILIGITIGGFLGATGLAPLGILLIILDYLKIGDYKSNLGTVLFVNLFPISIGAVFQFWKAKKINFTMGLLLIIGIFIGSHISANFVVQKENSLSIKTIKYTTAILNLIIAVLFLYSAYHEKN